MANPKPKPRKRTKSAAQHKRDGTYRADRHGQNDPPAFTASDDIHGPDYLSSDAKAEWERLAPELIRLGMFTVADRAMFATYCQSYSDYWKLTAELNALDSWATKPTEKGYVCTVPQVNTRMKVWAVLKEAAARFGFDPSSRASMDIKPTASPKSGEQSPEEFLFGPKLA